MTREEAIDYLSAIKLLLRDVGVDTEKAHSAIDIALAALRPITREQVEKVWSGCDLCLDDSWNRRLVIQKRFDHTTLSYGELALFCPGCGKPLTDEAVQMVMERLEALYGQETE